MRFGRGTWCAARPVRLRSAWSEQRIPRAADPPEYKVLSSPIASRGRRSRSEKRGLARLRGVEGSPAITQDDGADVRHRDVGDWEAELEARDAALRGQLLEITRCLESLGLRERQLALEATRIEARSVELDRREKALGEQEHELERRERAVAQRWARFASKGEHRGGGR